MLGTPPAFILSQDQTLLFNLWFRSTLVNLSRFYCLLGSFPSSFRISETVPLNNSFLEFSGLHYCLFVKVLCRLFSLPALSDLRAFLGRNGDYLITCCFLSQALFYFFQESFLLDSSKGVLNKSNHLLFLPVVPATKMILSSPFSFVNNKFHFFTKTVKAVRTGLFNRIRTGAALPVSFLHYSVQILLRFLPAILHTWQILP